MEAIERQQKQRPQKPHQNQITTPVVVPPQTFGLTRVLNQHDVICRQGGGLIAYEGNHLFRYVCWRIKDDYRQADRSIKSVIAQVVYNEMMTALDPPGQFVELLEGTEIADGLCREVPREKAIEKICQALREKTRRCPTSFQAMERHYQETRGVLVPPPQPCRLNGLHDLVHFRQIARETFQLAMQLRQDHNAKLMTNASGSVSDDSLRGSSNGDDTAEADVVILADAVPLLTNETVDLKSDKMARGADARQWPSIKSAVFKASPSFLKYGTSLSVLHRPHRTVPPTGNVQEEKVASQPIDKATKRTKRARPTGPPLRDGEPDHFRRKRPRVRFSTDPNLVLTSKAAPTEVHVDSRNAAATTKTSQAPRDTWNNTPAIIVNNPAGGGSTDPILCDSEDDGDNDDTSWPGDNFQARIFDESAVPVAPSKHSSFGESDTTSTRTRKAEPFSIFITEPWNEQQLQRSLWQGSGVDFYTTCLEQPRVKRLRIDNAEYPSLAYPYCFAHNL